MDPIFKESSKYFGWASFPFPERLFNGSIDGGFAIKFNDSEEAYKVSLSDSYVNFEKASLESLADSSNLFAIFKINKTPEQFKKESVTYDDIDIDIKEGTSKTEVFHCLRSFGTLINSEGTDYARTVN